MTTSFGNGITTPRGFRAAGGACGIKPSGKLDLALIVADQPCVAAGVFTTNRLPSPSVVVAKRHARSGKAQAIVCNSGISNAATGVQGEKDAIAMCELVAKHVPSLARRYRSALSCSTGVIGPLLPMTKIRRGIKALSGQLSRGPQANEDAARGIMTTDLVPKSAYRSVRIGGAKGKQVRLGAIAKGSGMISPNLATMLVFITTDAAITPPLLRRALKQAVSVSFNRISVDQHTSPSDSILVLASGLANHPRMAAAGDDLKRFTAALTDLCRDLAYQVVEDGEGATKVFCVRIVGAKNQVDADRIGRAVTDSPLVKTAIHGADPNWGRIVTAVGYSGASMTPARLSLTIGPRAGWLSSRFQSQPATTRSRPPGVCVFKRGQPTRIDANTARRLAGIMKGREITLTLDLGMGQASCDWLGCDLSRQYVAINADYTT